MLLTRLISLSTRYILWKFCKIKMLLIFIYFWKWNISNKMFWSVRCLKSPYFHLFSDNLQTDLQSNSWKISLNNLIDKLGPIFKPHKPNSSYLSEKVGYHCSIQTYMLCCILQHPSYRMHLVMHVTENMIKCITFILFKIISYFSLFNL